MVALRSAMAWEKGIAIQSRLKIPPISTRSKENPIIITIKSILFIGLFLTFAAALHPVQFLAIPLYWIHRPLFRSVQNYVKRAWAIFLIFITQVFGPSTLVITSDIVEEDFVLYKAGQPTVKLPHKAVVIANHQVRMTIKYDIRSVYWPPRLQKRYIPIGSIYGLLPISRIVMAVSWSCSSNHWNGFLSWDQLCNSLM